MLQNQAVHELFPTPIWVADLDGEQRDSLNAFLLKSIYDLTEPRKELPPGGSWQTDPVLHEHTAFSDFMSVATKMTRGALRFLDVEHERIVCTGCWANINPAGGKNSSHTHPNNYLSGVYYVQVPAKSGDIEFTDPRPQAGVIMPRSKTWNKFTGNKVSVPVAPGRMVVFPAWLNHAVPANTSTEHRISISFNFMFSHYTETMSATLWDKGSARLRG